jgi:hypothetical protein
MRGIIYKKHLKSFFNLRNYTIFFNISLFKYQDILRHKKDFSDYFKNIKEFSVFSFVLSIYFDSVSHPPGKGIFPCF